MNEDEQISSKPVEILLIEDNPGDIRLTRDALDQSEANYQLSVAGDGDQAMDVLHRRGRFSEAPTPSLIILDLNLPRRTGLEILQEIKGDAKLRRIPVIVFTSSTSQREINQSYDLHANCFIAKPVGLDRFMEVVASFQRFWINVAYLPSH